MREYFIENNLGESLEITKLLIETPVSEFNQTFEYVAYSNFTATSDSFNQKEFETYEDKLVITTYDFDDLKQLVDFLAVNAELKFRTKLDNGQNYYRLFRLKSHSIQKNSTSILFDAEMTLDILSYWFVSVIQTSTSPPPIPTETYPLEYPYRYGDYDENGEPIIIFNNLSSLSAPAMIELFGDFVSIKYELFGKNSEVISSGEFNDVNVNISDKLVIDSAIGKAQTKNKITNIIVSDVYNKQNFNLNTWISIPKGISIMKFTKIPAGDTEAIITYARQEVLI